MEIIFTKMQMILLNAKELENCVFIVNLKLRQNHGMGYLSPHIKLICEP